MSVDRETFIGIGYIVSHDEYETMLSAAGDRIGEVEDEFIYVNSYRDNTPVFLGESLLSIEEGCYDVLNESVILPYFDPEEFSEKYTRILEICGIDITPGSKWHEPLIYVIHRVY